MKTLTINQASREFAQAIHHFQDVSNYNVEFGLWSFSEKPYVKLYVACYPNGQFHHTHVQAENFYQALAGVQQWYQKIAPMEYAVETADSEPSTVPAAL